MTRLGVALALALTVFDAVAPEPVRPITIAAQSLTHFYSPTRARP